MRTLNLIRFILALAFLSAGCASEKKEASINFNIENSEALNFILTKGDYTQAYRLFEDNSEDIVSLKEGKATWNGELYESTFITVKYLDSIEGKYQKYIFYLSPGDNLNFSFDLKKPVQTYSVNGKGGKQNQPALQEIINSRIDLKAYRTDSLPNGVLRSIQEISEIKKNRLDEYVLENRPSKEFQDVCSLFVQYFAMQKFISFKGTQKFHIREPFLRNENEWQVLEDSLLKVIPVCNEQMLKFDSYDYFLSTYLSRIKERLWLHPELLKDYYETATQEEAVEMKSDDPENILKEKIIEKHFTGKTAEFLFATLFNRAILKKEDNLPEIFSRFKQKFPQSEYISYIEPEIQRIEKQLTRTLTDEMVILENSDSYRTFDDILKLAKGKTVLLDMWGTWCAPCRSDLASKSDSIKSLFKDKDLDYLYIANRDEGKDKKWRELIAYYNLTGIHLLASKELSSDIMKTLTARGYPAYAIIKKDGTFEVLERKRLIEQLNEILKE